MLILAIETSCDETSCAIVRDGVEVLSNVINSQTNIHQQFGGVVPEVASRTHIENIRSVVNEAIQCAEISLADVNAVAVANSPGLVGALLVGVSYAKGLAFGLNIPLIPVNHIHAHICSNFIEHYERSIKSLRHNAHETRNESDEVARVSAHNSCKHSLDTEPELKPPFICLVASGGHSHIVKVKGYCDFEVLARTRDDAAGEAYDKVARVLGLGYPGGPAVAKAAESGDESFLKLPRVKMGDSFDFSFSGVKTAVINYVHGCRQRSEELRVNDICASFQLAVNETLSKHLIDVANEQSIDTVALAGGVAANGKLRDLTERFAKESGKKFFCPPLLLCTDNAAMVGCSGYFNFKQGITADMGLNAVASL